ncbi:MAG: phenylacetate-CoA oxygenase subunit PaaC [Cytophagales bacterium]|jgi:ring-1,2-phenylacetyl-CoA epoxidase subunit PaaC|nr:phenylacetate-CoA oxygenase subunit PaaC [Cytophagales bacterium]MCA6388746.1 phenylacetate-CoA oxygenase subunit PaaC [Cytophagales bacterium]MCA6392501.1 phenylacetate-CoA oxygenase subunit PaaC [Cytophagales bacterium]MCA6394237.1 phenylacetate-CoA oxygenase subunit PaaC [Cytophagales bacterium]MCA6400171.1 phenylacetate-CoA oxygenase subunit PaaC [Cytophagales bacterium]
MEKLPLKELLYKMADDQLIIGHRNSEWTGFGPLLEEDIAFSSMAQDKIGHSLALYTILHELGESDPDTVAFTRNANQFHNSIFTELPNQEYDFSLVRHFLYDTAEALRFELLTNSTCEPLAQVARKVRGELRYHTLHAKTWLKQLGSATEESVGRLQKSLEQAMPYALGMFEESPYENEIIEAGIFEGEKKLKELWMAKVEETISQTSLHLPDWKIVQPITGGRIGKHTEHLQPLLDEMSEVFRIDPGAEW